MVLVGMVAAQVFAVGADFVGVVVGLIGFLVLGVG